MAFAKAASLQGSTVLSCAEHCPRRFCLCPSGRALRGLTRCSGFTPPFAGRSFLSGDRRKTIARGLSGAGEAASGRPSPVLKPYGDQAKIPGPVTHGYGGSENCGVREAWKLPGLVPPASGRGADQDSPMVVLQGSGEPLCGIGGFAHPPERPAASPGTRHPVLHRKSSHSRLHEPDQSGHG